MPQASVTDSRKSTVPDVRITLEPGPGHPGQPDGFALGLATIYNNRVLDVIFPCTNVKQNYGSAALFWNALQYSKSRVAGELDLNSLMLALDFFDEHFDGTKRGVSFYKKHGNVNALEDLVDTVMLDEHPLSAYGYRYGVVLAW